MKIVERDGFRLVINPRPRDKWPEGIIDLTPERKSKDALGVEKWDVVDTYMLSQLSDDVHNWRDDGRAVTAMLMLLMPDEPWTRDIYGKDHGPIQLVKR